MATIKYKVLKTFSDQHTAEVYRIGQEIELTEERFDEAVESLEIFGGGYLEAVEKEVIEDDIDGNNDDKVEDDGDVKDVKKVAKKNKKD